MVAASTSEALYVVEKLLGGDISILLEPNLIPNPSTLIGLLNGIIFGLEICVLNFACLTWNHGSEASIGGPLVQSESE